MEKNWRNNISSEVNNKVDKMFEMLELSKEDIIKEVTKDLELVEKMKVEEKETYDYAVFQKWLDECTKQAIMTLIERGNK